MTEEAASVGAASAASTLPVSGGAASDRGALHPTAHAVHVLRRLERIEALDREGAPSPVLLGELRELVHEADAWARAEAVYARARQPRNLTGRGKE